MLDVLNKEQRGYATPSEFNNFARQAQLEIFEHYFYDKSHFSINAKGTVSDNIMSIIQEKIDLFEVRGSSVDLVSGQTRFSLPENLYRIGDVYYTNEAGETLVVSKIDHKMSQYVKNSSKMQPSVTFPKYERYGNQIEVSPVEITSGITLDYIKRPSDPVWNSITFGSRAPVYDDSSSNDFELHPSEEYVIVEKILLYLGVSVREPVITQIAAQDLQADATTKKQ